MYVQLKSVRFPVAQDIQQEREVINTLKMVLVQILLELGAPNGSRNVKVKETRNSLQR